MYIYNCHTHVFNMDCAPDRFLNGYAGKAGAWVLHKTLRVPLLKHAVRWAARRAPFAKKQAAFLHIGTEMSQQSIFEDRLTPHYPSGTRFVVLTLNMDLMGAGNALHNYETQLWEVLDLRRRNPDTCLPFLCVDPRMGGARWNRNFVEKWLNRGFVGLKMYPALGFYPFDDRLSEVYALAEERALPIMVHCSRGGIYYRGTITPPLRSPALPQAGVVRQQLAYLQQQARQQQSSTGLYDQSFPLHARKPRLGATPLGEAESADDFCDLFLDPRAYDLVLAQWPRLKLCLAHYAGGREIDAGTAPGADPQDLSNWYHGIRWLMRKYPNVYTDVSYTLFEDKRFPLILRDLQDPLYQNRLLFGTDFFMAEQDSTEADLAVKLHEYLVTNAPETWQRLATDNPACYLHSSNYTPVEHIAEAPLRCKSHYDPTTSSPGLNPLWQPQAASVP